MNAIAPALIQKLQELPPQQIAEVEDFVEFLTDRANKRSEIVKWGQHRNIFPTPLRPFSPLLLQARHSAANALR